MDTKHEIVEFEKVVRGAGLGIADVLREAGIDRSMWTRWKNGTTVPRLDNWRSMEKAFETLSAKDVPDLATAS